MSGAKGRYPRIKDYEGFEIDPKEEMLRLACCDCGLVHSIAIVVSRENPYKMPVSPGMVKLAFRREPRATAQLRRHKFGGLQNRRIGKWTMTT